MSTTYFLSNRQLKELLVRGRPLTILLPAPPMAVADLIAWARSMMDPQVRHLVRGAVRAMVRVEPGTSSDGLAGLLGGVDRRQHSVWTVGIDAVSVDLSPDRPKCDRAVSQWPHHVVHDGLRIPEGEQ